MGESHSSTFPENDASAPGLRKAQVPGVALSSPVRRVSSLLLVLTPLAACQSVATTTPSYEPALSQTAHDEEIERFAQLTDGVAFDDLQLVRSRIDRLGTQHLRVQQSISGVPVWGGEAILHVRKGGDVAVTDALVRDIRVS